MIRRDELVEYLDKFLEADREGDYCPQGLQVEGKEEIDKVVTAVTASVELFRLAARASADLILVHHGILWDRDSRVLQGGFRERVRLLLEHEMTLCAYHLPLDRHPLLGNNVIGARMLGLKGIEGFGEVGVRGRIPPLGIDAFAELVSTAFGVEPMVFPEGPELIEQVGFCSGAGQGDLPLAITTGLDAFVTGEVSLPVLHQAREGHIHFVAAGHYATERPGIIALGDHIQSRFGLEVEFIDVPNPI